jgi:hypothetical protein
VLRAHDRPVQPDPAAIQQEGPTATLSRIRNRAQREISMNPRTRHAALYAIGVIAILASANALAHSYAGLYDWAVHHHLTGWQAMSWPAEIDVFLAVGELALYVAYLDGWPVRQRIWPWTTALVGLAVSIAGNVGHIQAQPGQPVILAGSGYVGGELRFQGKLVVSNEARRLSGWAALGRKGVALRREMGQRAVRM